LNKKPRFRLRWFVKSQKKGNPKGERSTSRIDEPKESIHPNPGLFFVAGLEALAQASIPKGEWLGVYDDIEGQLLAVGRSPRDA
jgi:hypothetical protein